MASGSPSTRSQIPHRLELREGGQPGQGLEVWEGEGGNWKFLLARDAQHGAAADQHAQPGASFEQLGRNGCGLEHLLEVVEH